MKKQFSEEQKLRVLKEADAATTVQDVIRKHGISRQTFYQWKRKYDGLKAGNAERLKRLEDENAEFKKLVKYLTYENQRLQKSRATTYRETMKNASKEEKELRSINYYADYVNSIDIGPLDHLVGYHIRRVDLKVLRTFYREMESTGITPALYTALILIMKNEGINQSALSAALGIARSGVMSILDRLEDLGIAKRHPHPTDARSVQLFLTEDGQVQLQKYAKRIKRFDDEMFSMLSDVEHSRLIDLLRKVN